MRRLDPLHAFALVALTSCAPAVTSENLNNVDAGPNDPDAAPNHIDAGPNSPDAAIAPSCDAYNSSQPAGHHNPGRACLTCHDGYTATKWTLAGTVYSSAGSSTGVAGATVHVTDKSGMTLALVTASNGNYYTQTALTFPVTISASLCPNTVPMASTVASSGADCNSCHSTGSRIHLP